MDEYIDGLKFGIWIDEWMDGWMDGSIDRSLSLSPIYLSLSLYISLSVSLSLSLSFSLLLFLVARAQGGVNDSSGGGGSDAWPHGSVRHGYCMHRLCRCCLVVPPTACPANTMPPPTGSINPAARPAKFSFSAFQIFQLFQVFQLFSLARKCALPKHICTFLVILGPN